MEKQADVIKLKIMRTANGYYIEHEADKVINSYSVTCEADDWNALNPAFAGSFETPFTVEPVEPELTRGSADTAKTVAALTAKVTELEAVNVALAEKEAVLTALQEAAGEIDIMQLIENAKAAAKEATAPEANNPELPLTDEKAADPAAEKETETAAAEKETGKGSKSSKNNK